MPCFKLSDGFIADVEAMIFENIGGIGMVRRNRSVGLSGVSCVLQNVQGDLDFGI